MEQYTIELLNQELKLLEVKNKELIQTGKLTIETFALYQFDIFCAAIINRTLNLTRGFINQMRDENFISAAPLVRINLDSLLRLYGAFLVEYNIDEFALEVMKGKAFNSIKDKTGQFMKDHYLVDQLSKKTGYNWVKTVYKAGNEHIHFTAQHVFASVRTNDDPDSKTIQGIMAHGDSFMEMKEKIWAVRAMFQIIVGIQEQLSIWIAYKKALAIKKQL